MFTEHVRIRSEKFGAVIFETLHEKVFVTNRTGEMILRLLQDGKTAEEVIAILEGRYGDRYPQVREDTISFLNQLREKRILT